MLKHLGTQSTGLTHGHHIIIHYTMSYFLFFFFVFISYSRCPFENNFENFTAIYNIEDFECQFDSSKAVLDFWKSFVSGSQECLLTSGCWLAWKSNDNMGYFEANIIYFKKNQYCFTDNLFCFRCFYWIL